MLKISSEANKQLFYRKDLGFDYDYVFDRALEIVNRTARYYDRISIFNTEKVMQAFRDAKVADYYLKPTTGYAYDDVGRDSLDLVYAKIFKTEAALVRSQFVSGTHALAVAMIGNLKAGDEVIGATGTPYDTMQTIIGYPKCTPGSLTAGGIKFIQVPMKGTNPDIVRITASISSNTKMVHIQRSCGYSDVRGTLSISDIASIIKAVKDVNPNIICFVDNCYGEFTEMKEPTEVGADLMAGSLIKNLGGGIAPTGGYVVGKKELVYNAACRLTVPGLAGEMGATLGDTARDFYQGLFVAPHVVMQAIRTVTFAAAVFEKMGYEVKPSSDEIRHDIVQRITLNDSQRLINFCQAIQMFSPVDSLVTPEPSNLPGYEDKVIMAAGTFVQGASIELSADAPIRKPYNVFLQGGLTWEHGVSAIKAAAKMVCPNKKKKATQTRKVCLKVAENK